MILDDQALATALEPLPATWQPKPGQRDAAVLAPIFGRGGEDWLILTERRGDLPQHPGQISFPGGAREGDEDPVRCALRESEEEIGIRPDAVVLLGALPSRTSSSAFRVHALVGRVPERVDLRPDPREVSALLEVRWAELLDEERWTERTHRTGGRTYRSSPHFAHGSHVIWGLTGRLIRDLVAAVRSIRPGFSPRPG